MRKISCIIIEDEPLAARVLSDYIAHVPFLELQQVFKDAMQAAAFFQYNETDLMFLDIHLPKLKGMAFLKTLTDPPAVIVTTAYHQYAVEGFNLNVTDYLLKPIEFERFLAAVNKVKAAQKPAAIAERDFIFVNVQKRRVRIAFAEILFIESQREYIRIVTTKQEYITKMSTGEIEELLPDEAFKRVHRSFIVAVNKIDAYTAEVIQIHDVEIPVGRGYKDVLDGL